MPNPRLYDVVARALGADASSVSDVSSPDTLRRWNSLRHLDLVTAVEDAYGVRFSTAEIVRVKSVADIRSVLREKGVEAG